MSFFLFKKILYVISKIFYSELIMISRLMSTFERTVITAILFHTALTLMLYIYGSFSCKEISRLYKAVYTPRWLVSLSQRRCFPRSFLSLLLLFDFVWRIKYSIYILWALFRKKYGWHSLAIKFPWNSDSLDEFHILDFVSRSSDMWINQRPMAI